MIGRIYFGDDKKPDIWLIKIKVEPVEKRDINEETGMDLPTFLFRFPSFRKG
jgi:hypothetical protein